MARPRSRRGWLPLLALLVVLAHGVVAPGASSANGDDGYKVIVHPSNPATTISRDQLRRAYLKKTTSWSDGTTIRPVDLPTKVSARDRFTREVVKKTPAQLRAYWNAQIFSGKGVPPPEARSASAAITYVLANPGALAYVPSDVEIGDAKVLAVK